MVAPLIAHLDDLALARGVGEQLFEGREVRSGRFVEMYPLTGGHGADGVAQTLLHSRLDNDQLDRRVVEDLFLVEPSNVVEHLVV